MEIFIDSVTYLFLGLPLVSHTSLTKQIKQGQVSFSITNLIVLTGVIFADDFQIFLFFRRGRVVEKLQSNGRLDVIEGHLLDLGDGEDGLAGCLVHGRHPTQTALVTGDLPHAQVNYGVDLSVVVEIQLLYQKVLHFCLILTGQIVISCPKIVFERLLQTVHVLNVGIPLETLH